MYRVHITLSNVSKIFTISEVYLLRNNSKSLNHYWIIHVSAEWYIVILNGGVYSGFNSYRYFNACACALRGTLLSACPRLASHNSENTHQNENRFLAFGILTSKAEVENMISVCIIVCSKLSGI